MTTTTDSYIGDTYRELMQSKTFFADMYSFRDSFFKFVTENDAYLWMEYFRKPYYKATAEEYSIDIRHTDVGVMFSAILDDGNCGDIHKFIIPFEYVQNKDAWEESLLNEMAHDRLWHEAA